jgi:hypothetical protein
MVHAALKLSRRELLRVGTVGLSGLGLSHLLAADEIARHDGLQPRADSLIVIFLNGGPSHLDMWDMKPDAPAETRGEFAPIASSLSGVQLSEHLPKLALHMHRCTLVRSMHHSVNNAHAAAVYVALTGHDRGEIGGGTRPTDRPGPGSVCALLRPTVPEVVPYVALPYMTREGAGGPPQPGFFGGILGSSFDPLWILRDPNASDFSVPELTLQHDVSAERIAARGRLLTSLNARLVDRSQVSMAAMQRFQQQATDILTSHKTSDAFHLDQEPSAVRDAYGRNVYGQSVLLARRLIEAGTRVVTVSWAPDANATWDTHGGNFRSLKNTLLPQFDAACSSLLTDLADRKMLDRTIVAVLGDFGRTPKINNNNAGRDHWNFCYSILLAGGGFREGYVHGASDRIGAFPADRPTIPGDILATIYRLLGIEHRAELFDRLQRPHQIVAHGDVVAELLA